MTMQIPGTEVSMVDMVKVNVRLAPSKAKWERWLAFRRPDRIPTMVLLNEGYAIDGTHAVISVVGTADAPLDRALQHAEMNLIGFLSLYGYGAEFG